MTNLKNRFHNFIRFAALLTVSAVCAVLLCSCAKQPEEHSLFAMGSLFSAKLCAPDSASVWTDILDSVTKADSLLSLSSADSDASRLARDGDIAADPYTVSVYKDAADICGYCGGKIDITLGAVTTLWGFGGETPSLPSDADIREALTTRGLDGVHIDTDTNRIRTAPGQITDPGAFGKGAACDAAYEALRGHVSSALITFGGTVLLCGENPNGKGWTVGVRDPAGSANDWFALLTFSGTADTPVFVSTSGNYEKTFTENGKTYHHILDPDTGYPVENGLASVTVTGGSGITSDALSTACFVNGLNAETLGWLEHYRSEAVFVFTDGRVYVTDGLKNSFRLTDPAFRLTDSYEE